MSRLSQIVGVALLVVGFVGYFASGMTSPTAFIPAFFGVAISVLGFYGRHDPHARGPLTLALGVALVGIIGSFEGLLNLPAVLQGGAVERPAAVLARSAMAVILIAYVVGGLSHLRKP